MTKKLLLAALLCFLFTACDDANNQIACTEEARSSIVLKIQNANTGDIMDAATVTFTVHAETTTITCDDNASGLEYCGSLTLAYEVDGKFDITVSSPGFQDKSTSVTITKDQCHVIGKNLTINLKP